MEKKDSVNDYFKVPENIRELKEKLVFSSNDRTFVNSFSNATVANPYVPQTLKRTIQECTNSSACINIYCIIEEIFPRFFEEIDEIIKIIEVKQEEKVKSLRISSFKFTKK